MCVCAFRAQIAMGSYMEQMSSDFHFRADAEQLCTGRCINEAAVVAQQ